MENGAASGVDFCVAARVVGDRFTATVPCSGREGPFGIEYSYVQPTYIVVQYSMYNDECSALRKRLQIPTGRGPRVMQLALP